ncbi:MAG TPA: NblA/ycf18 family protein [Coleofasciculaceae cyanobacterium]
MNQPMELSFEQQFSIRCFADQVQQMSREQAQEFLLMLYQQMMIKDTMYQNFLKQEWKLDSGAIAHLRKEANRDGL